MRGYSAVRRDSVGQFNCLSRATARRMRHGRDVRSTRLPRARWRASRRLPRARYRRSRRNAVRRRQASRRLRPPRPRHRSALLPREYAAVRGTRIRRQAALHINCAVADEDAPITVTLLATNGLRRSAHSFRTVQSWRETSASAPLRASASAAVVQRDVAAGFEHAQLNCTMPFRYGPRADTAARSGAALQLRHGVGRCAGRQGDARRRNPCKKEETGEGARLPPRFVIGQVVSRRLSPPLTIAKKAPRSDSRGFACERVPLTAAFENVVAERSGRRRVTAMPLTGPLPTVPLPPAIVQ